MSVAVTIRNVPDEVRNELAARAARSGRSLQEYLRRELIELASKPSTDDWLAQLRARGGARGAQLSPDQIVSAIRADRDDPDR